jgi:phage minor structural protein
MYVIKLDGFAIHGAGTERLTVYNPILETGLDFVGSLAFEMPRTNVGYGKITENKSILEVFVDSWLIWRGHALTCEQAFNGVVSVYAEGILGCANNIIARPHSVLKNIPGYIDYLLGLYNTRADTNKQITRGTVQITGDTITRVSEEYMSVRKLFDDGRKFQGGYFLMRHNGDVNYLDYLKDFPLSPQPINFGQNLIDVKIAARGENLATVLVPAARVEGSDTALTIASVNGGNDYLINTAARTKYGWIERNVYYEGVTTAATLLSKAQADLPNVTGMQTTITANAIDLSLIDKSIAAFRLGERVHVISPPHSIDEELRVSSIRLNMANPDRSEMVLGDPVYLLTGRSTL